MSFKHVILGICVTAAALTATVTTVSAAGPEGGFAMRTTGTISTGPAATAGTATGTATATGLFARPGATSFDDAQNRSPVAEEALPASSLSLLALAGLLAVGLMMTRRGGQA